jgi:hypothetical protein
LGFLLVPLRSGGSNRRMWAGIVGLMLMLALSEGSEHERQSLLIACSIITLIMLSVLRGDVALAARCSRLVFTHGRRLGRSIRIRAR